MTAPKKRYCVRVFDRDGDDVFNEPVTAHELYLLRRFGLFLDLPVNHLNPDRLSTWNRIGTVNGHEVLCERIDR